MKNYYYLCSASNRYRGTAFADRVSRHLSRLFLWVELAKVLNGSNEPMHPNEINALLH